MEVTHNILLQGLSGRLGDMIYYNRYGKTFARKAPTSYNKVATEKQAAIRDRFLAAVAFAKYVISDPALKAEYQRKAKKDRNAYTAAMAEYLAMHK